MADKNIPKLYNAWFCPFAQRAWIALEEKRVPFEYIEQNPYNKSAEWLAINPTGLVPAIVHEGKVIWESGVCIEYVDEALQGPKLLPEDAYGRAKVRMWSDFINKKIVRPYYAILMKQTKEEQEEQKKLLLEALAKLSAEIDEDGPFFLGKKVGMVDIMLFPHAYRFRVLDHYRTFQVPKTDQYSKYHRMMEALNGLECVKKTLPDYQKLIESYDRYYQGTAKTEVGDAIRKGEGLP